MALRTAEEIREKIGLLRRAAITPAEIGLRLILIGFVTIVLTVYFSTKGGNWHKLWWIFGAPSAVLFMAILFIQVPRFMTKRKLIAKNLEEILDILAKPEGVDKFYELLDESIVEKNACRQSFLVTPFIKVTEKDVRSARAQAFTWVASPDRIPNDEEL